MRRPYGSFADKDRRVRFGLQSRLKVEKEFSEEMVVNKTITDLYGLDCHTHIINQIAD